MKKKKNFNFILGAIITAIMGILLVYGMVALPYDPDAMDGSLKFAKVSMSHLMGCDNFGRDIFSRVLSGMQITLFVAIFTVLIGTLFGIIIGGICGYYGGIVDEVLMRINDGFFAFPSILLALVMVSVFGTGTFKVSIALGIAFIPSFARIVRGEFVKQKNLDYVRSAKLFGASDMRIIFIHILPNVYPVLISSIMIGFSNAVLAEAGMSYLGIGVQPPDASLGRMLSEAQTYLFSTPSFAIFPGLIIVLIILGVSLVADGIKSN